MTGENNLDTLIASMQPALRDEVYVFCTLPETPPGDQLARLAPRALFIEDEGTTLVVRREAAEAERLAFTYPARMITLTIHSSLEAVGFMAAMTRALADHGISVNAFSAYFHDHLFVPEDKAEDALRTLRDLAATKRAALTPAQPKPV
jgi:hypothetical protein